jgi:Nickel/cobalt transporter regulator
MNDRSDPLLPKCNIIGREPSCFSGKGWRSEKTSRHEEIPMNKMIAALFAAACLIAPLAAVPAAAAAPIVKDVHHPVVHRGSWARGHRLSPSDLHRAIPFDYTRYRLSPPPHGYQWVRIGGSFLLVGLTSGLILKVAAAR